MTGTARLPSLEASIRSMLLAEALTSTYSTSLPSKASRAFVVYGQPGLPKMITALMEKIISADVLVTRSEASS